MRDIAAEIQISSRTTFSLELNIVRKSVLGKFGELFFFSG